MNAFEKIKERLEEEIAWYETHGCDKTLKRGIVGATRKALSIVSEVEAEYGNGWIPCSERLPADNTRVFACFSSGTVTELVYLGEGIFRGLYEYTTKVILAWMPLPESYKPET